MSKSSNIILVDWLNWHFFEMPAFLTKVWKNYLDFATNYFSVPLLLKTFFSPWKRYLWAYPKGLDFWEIFSTFVSNFFSRIIGAIIRIFLIIAGFAFQIFVLLSGFIILAFWIFMPVLIVFGILFLFAY